MTQHDNDSGLTMLKENDSTANEEIVPIVGSVFVVVTYDLIYGLGSTMELLSGFRDYADG